VSEPGKGDSRPVALIDCPKVSHPQSPHSLEALQRANVKSRPRAIGTQSQQLDGEGKSALGFPVQLFELPLGALGQAELDFGQELQFQSLLDGIPVYRFFLPEPPKVLPDEGPGRNLIHEFVEDIVIVCSSCFVPSKPAQGILLEGHGCDRARHQ